LLVFSDLHLRATGAQYPVVDPPVDQYDLYTVFVDDGDRLAAIGAAPGCVGVSTAATPYYAPADGDSEIAAGADAPSSG